jgi:cytochrome oxidase Cu insertion factor (SCO1/SenC/PrrC family)
MIKTFVMAAAAILMVAGAADANATAANVNKKPTQVGQKAPDFTGTDTNGKTVKLSDYAGKTVVLEWTNAKCPFVVKHYGSGNMQSLQEKYTGQGVVWISINSSAEGKEGYVNGADANQIIAEEKGKASTYIIDKSGEIGRLYDAKTTPNMYVIDGEGTLVYAGAIDSDDSFKPETIAGATNYVAAALDSLTAGKPIEVSQTKPYGCGVKY